jgi:uncharacterized membrane protein YfcA
LDHRTLATKQQRRTVSIALLVAAPEAKAGKGMADYLADLLVGVGVFAGATVSGLVGFAFSAVAGGILVHILRPSDAVPLMMVCSIGVQGASLLFLRHKMEWRGSMMFIVGGAFGILPGLYLLFHLDTATLRVGFGLFLAIYSGFMVLRPTGCHSRKMGGCLHDVAVGFAGGLIGSVTAMPGALPTIWCQLRGLSKDQQRGLVQPFIAFMQIIALALLVSRGKFSANSFQILAISLPALAAGTALGFALFGRVNETHFRRVVCAVLLVSGFALVV